MDIFVKGDILAKKKYYAVKCGLVPGIYETWAECQKQVKGFPNAKFKSFPHVSEAEAFMAQDNTILADGQSVFAVVGGAAVAGSGAGVAEAGSGNAGVTIFVDGSYFNGDYSWGMAVYENGVLVQTFNGKGTSKAAAKLHNVAGEMQGAMEAVKWADANGVEKIRLCYDYNGIAEWALGNWKAKLPETQAYALFMSNYLDMVEFVKVAGHTGVEGNELADKLAKAALE